MCCDAQRSLPKEKRSPFFLNLLCQKGSVQFIELLWKGIPRMQCTITEVICNTWSAVRPSALSTCLSAPACSNRRTTWNIGDKRLGQGELKRQTGTGEQGEMTIDWGRRSRVS